MDIIFLVIGIFFLVKGADLFVDGASSIASNIKIPTIIVGLTIVAVGTSLPELVTSIVATRKGESGLALGNAVGSNVFNILFILGMSSTISPIVLDSVAIYDAIVLLGVALLTYLFAKTKEEVSSKEGWIMILSYVAYTAYLLIR